MTLVGTATEIVQSLGAVGLKRAGLAFAALREDGMRPELGVSSASMRRLCGKG